LVGLFAMSIAMLSGAARVSASSQRSSGEVPSKGEARVKGAILASAEPSLARVSMRLRIDRGHDPYGGGWSYFCANCGTRHNQSLFELVVEERAAQEMGIVVAPDLVIVRDPLVPDRFIESIRVAHGSDECAATIEGVAQDEAALLLRLERPLAGAVPMKFGATGEGDLFVISGEHVPAGWQHVVQPLSTGIVRSTHLPDHHPAPIPAVIVDGTGAACGLAFNGRVRADSSWQRSPLDWAWLRGEARSELVELARRFADQSILRVSLSFRSPSAGARRRDPFDMSEDQPDVMSVPGVMIDAQRILVLHHMDVRRTARLSRVRVHSADGRECAAEFEGTLRDWGAFVAKLPEAMGIVPGLSPQSPLEHRDRALPEAEVLVQGETRLVLPRHDRLARFSIGWREQVSPSLQSDLPAFVFDPEGRLLAFELPRRVVGDEPGRRDEARAIASADLLAALSSGDSAFDRQIVPLDEAQENRIAWLGADLQALDEELARASGVSELTNDGEFGAIVTHVHASSPAAAAGVQVGDVLLHVIASRLPKPLPVSADESFWSDQPFPWDQLDEVPEEFYDQIPAPWPSADSSLAVALTELGFGTAFQLELAREGEAQMIGMTVLEGPAHFASAPRHEDAATGVTVCDLTYEVRHYLQRGADEPGVVVCDLEPGGKASVAGVKPFELITAVNGFPVTSASHFGELITQPGQIKLEVRRMARGRQVVIEPG